MLFNTRPTAVEVGTSSLSAMLKVTELQEKILESEQLLIAVELQTVSHFEAF
jgi:hypothetical protein